MIIEIFRELMILSDIAALHGVPVRPAGLEYPERGRQVEALQQYTQYLRR